MRRLNVRRAVCALCAAVMLLAAVGVSAECQHLNISYKAKTNDDINHCRFTRYCNDCGEYFDYDVRTIHNRNTSVRIQGEPYEAPTCEKNGYQWATCGRCGSKWQMTLYKIDHTYTSEITPPTCTEQGYTLKTCTMCGGTEKTDYTKAPGHSYRWKRVEPTCTEKGYKEYACQHCNDFYWSDYTDALGHLWSDADADGARYCLREGCKEVLRPVWIKAAGSDENEVFARVDPVDGCLYIKAPIRATDESASVIAHGETDLSFSLSTEGGLFTLKTHAQDQDAIGFVTQSDDTDTSRLMLTRNSEPMDIKEVRADGGSLVVTMSDGTECTLQSDLAEYVVKEEPKPIEEKKPVTIIFTTKEITPKVEITFTYKTIDAPAEPEEAPETEAEKAPIS